MRPEEPHKEPLSKKQAELKNVVAGAGAVNVLEPAGNSSDAGDQFNFDADSRSESDVEMSAEPVEPQVEREKPQVEPEEPPMEPEELEPQFSLVESSSDSSSYSDTVSTTSMSVSTGTESGANKESEPEPEAVVEPQVELKLQVSPAGSSDDSDSDIDSDYFDCSSCRPVDTISLPLLLLCRLKERLLYLKSAAVSWENRHGLTVPETCGMAAILKKMSVMMMVMVVCLCMMSPASAVLAYESICISNVEEVNFSG
jgi:hypothetical protein